MSLFKKFSKIQIWIMGVLFFVLGTAHLKALENVENLWSARIPISLEGTIRPIEIIREQTSVGGRIIAITVQENDEVQKNQLLLSLKNDTQKQQLEIARLQQKINKNNLRDREQQISLTKVQIDMSKNSLMVQETNLKDIRRRLKDEQTLFEQGSSTKSQLDAIQLELDRGMLSLSNAELNLLKSKQDSTRAQLGKENTALTLKLSEQDVILKKDNLNDTMIRSKISGIVIKKYFEEGEVVGNGARLFDIVNIDRVEIEVGVKEEDLSRIQIGQKVVFTTPAYPNQRFAGKVDRLSWTANTQDGKFPVFIHAANPNLKLRSGMSAKVYMVSAE